MASLRSAIAKLQEEDQSLTQQHEKRRKQFALLLHLCAELEGLTEGEMPEAVATVAAAGAAAAEAGGADGREEEAGEKDSKPAKKRKTAA